jgi:hypothetical protein
MGFEKEEKKGFGNFLFVGNFLCGICDSFAASLLPCF